MLIIIGYFSMSNRNGAKFRELSQTFPKLADWAVHWQVTLPGCTGDGHFQTVDNFFAQPCPILAGAENMRFSAGTNFMSYTTCGADRREVQWPLCWQERHRFALRGRGADPFHL